MPSGKQSKRRRREAQAELPPPVGGKRAGPPRRVPTTQGPWLSGRTLRRLGAGGAVAVAVIVLAIALTGGSSKPVHVDFAQMTGLQKGPPPWNDGVGELTDRLSQVRLDPLRQEALAFHIHQHLDLYVDGKHVAVPASIGIDDNSYITEMHTHDASGVLHVESPKNRPYTLGQLFGEWSVRLNANCLGRYCGDLRWWVNGKPQTGSPADLVVRDHQEIVIAAGKLPAHIPSSYAFPSGE